MIYDMRDILTVEVRTLTPDGGGGYTESWETAAEIPNIYAAIIPVTGGKRLMHRQMMQETTVKIRTRYQEGFDGDFRLTDGTFCYYPLSVQDSDGKKTYLDILAEKR